MKLRYSALPTAYVRPLQAGAPDAYGNRPERTTSDGGGNPCRHCLTDIPAGAGMLIAAHRLFSTLQPYAETGPVFLCEAPCVRHPDSGSLPALFASRKQLLVRGYGSDERIRYGTGRIVPAGACDDAARDILADPQTAFVHLRSATNNCYQCRVERGE